MRHYSDEYGAYWNLSQEESAERPDENDCLALETSTPFREEQNVVSKYRK